ncbi:PDZ domain-containing protein [Neisseriaceae bacterium TC5R-5]|nr:PDZ domain-containing protein [Neisseriaceae bacterium TC5R-5]
MTTPVSYTLSPRSPEAHLFDITVTVLQPAQTGQIFSLPAWIPGSYMIREFSKHIVTMRAESAGQAVTLIQLSKNSWQAAPCKAAITLHYQVYAFDLSVRGAYLDSTRGFYNGSSVFLAVSGYEQESCTVRILPATGKPYADWKVATSLAAIDIKKKTGFGTYQAANYEELIDHPVELGEFEHLSFKACGVEHELVVAGRHRADLKRLVRDIKKICEYQITLFGKPAPFTRYVFMLFVGHNIYGGLEHRNSTALMANRDDLPAPGAKDISEGYLKLLGLISHEYFHSWNVKRIKPAAFTPYKLNQEAYTRLLWAFEGITSYYDDLILARCGLIDEQRYLTLLAETISSVQRGPGRLKQNLEQSSFEAWTKYYRQDENSPNSLVSYYTKGALVALALDLYIRRESQNKLSLDDVMRAIWQKYLDDGKGLAEQEWEQLASEITGLNLSAFFEQALRSTQDLPLTELLASQGITMHFAPARKQADRGGITSSTENRTPLPSLGIKASLETQGLRLIHVYDGGAGQQAGLAGGDTIVALDNLKAVDLDQLLCRYRIGDEVKLHFFRRDELHTVKVRLQAGESDVCHLSLGPDGGKWIHKQPFPSSKQTGAAGMET